MFRVNNKDTRTTSTNITYSATFSCVSIANFEQVIVYCVYRNNYCPENVIASADVSVRDIL